VLRRLPTWVLLALGLGWIFMGELVVGALGLGPASLTPALHQSLLWVPGVYPMSAPVEMGPWVSAPFRVIVYPLVPWLAIMLLGWCFGRFLAARQNEDGLERRAARLLFGWGIGGLVIFLAQRLLDGPAGAYGNFWLPRSDGSLLRWLQVSKYPPSLAFYALELGLMACLLAALFRLQVARGEGVSRNAPLRVFGETALFFYLLHIHLLALFGALVFGANLNHKPFGVVAAWLFAAGVLFLLYPVCRWFRGAKARRPESLLRFL
jgi:uncharacterized membrane protein